MAGFDGMNGEFVSRLQALMAAARGAGHNITIGSGYRSPERQAQLWEQALAKYGDPEIADNWVARPGKSNHGRGIAADLGFSSDAAIAWVHDNASRYGLHFPMSWEPWHIEPIGVEGLSDRGAYTTPPAGQVNPQDLVNDPYSLDTQFRNFLGSMSLEQMIDSGTAASPEIPGVETPELSSQPEAQAGALVEEMS